MEFFSQIDVILIPIHFVLLGFNVEPDIVLLILASRHFNSHTLHQLNCFIESHILKDIVKHHVSELWVSLLPL